MLLWGGIVALVLALDRATKLLAQLLLKPGEPVRAIAGVLEWRLSYNQGMALGLFAGQRWPVLLLPILAVGLGWLLLRHYRSTGYTRIATALIVGGFAGNWIDRLIAGRVTDMVYFPWMPWYICNMADIAICAGVAMMAVSLLLRPGDWREKHENADRTA